MAAANAKPLHVAMFPWLAFGHIMPYLDLAKHIARKGHTISFLTTPRNIQRLPKLPPEYSSSISFVAIPLPSVPGLPAGAEATMDIEGATQMGFLKKAFDGLEPAVIRFLEAAVPDWVITDFLPHWLPAVTGRLGIPSALFFIFNAWFLSFFGSAQDLVIGSDYRTRPEDFMVPPRWIKFDTSLAYRRFEANWVVGSGQNAESGFSDQYRCGKIVIGCDAIVIRHCHEFEPDWLPLLEELHHRKVIPLGLMPPQVDNRDSAGDDDRTWISIKSWLDRKEKGSVVYVAFGSEVTLTREQLTELAHGLELSNVPFFWALRRITDSAVLPNGFEERVMGRGIVWKSWSPQLKILSHGSVGGFLTHCGWSSIVEGLMCGHPLITLPFLVDQGLNSRIIVHKGLAYEVARDKENGAYTRESVAESVKVVMSDNNKGRDLREKAKEVSKVFGDSELHGKYVDKFVEYLVEHTRLEEENKIKE
ncbi:putative UDP-rhamnose:rhamnosyltransferase 1 [Andrographis paniculata]|uniref:putative UDP-rhamnose:rhamnosyltransferase 1 n=1 Tax=Andrographis paniculata TaxID=175694 RepID=UPI0021E977BB|nr:putative UDP-rhamnose:rhamnosyltransferase 1 [Andrographis paniculata]